MPARVIVMPEHDPDTVLLSETVVPAHLDSEHSALQFLERLVWALEDAERRATAR